MSAQLEFELDWMNMFGDFDGEEIQAGKDRNDGVGNDDIILNAAMQTFIDPEEPVYKVMQPTSSNAEASADVAVAESGPDVAVIESGPDVTDIASVESETDVTDIAAVESGSGVSDIAAVESVPTAAESQPVAEIQVAVEEIQGTEGEDNSNAEIHVRGSLKKLTDYCGGIQTGRQVAYTGKTLKYTDAFRSMVTSMTMANSKRHEIPALLFCATDDGRQYVVVCTVAEASKLVEVTLENKAIDALGDNNKQKRMQEMGRDHSKAKMPQKTKACVGDFTEEDPDELPMPIVEVATDADGKKRIKFHMAIACTYRKSEDEALAPEGICLRAENGDVLRAAIMPFSASRNMTARHCVIEEEDENTNVQMLGRISKLPFYSAEEDAHVLYFFRNKDKRCYSCGEDTLRPKGSLSTPTPDEKALSPRTIASITNDSSHHTKKYKENSLFGKFLSRAIQSSPSFERRWIEILNVVDVSNKIEVAKGKVKRAEERKQVLAKAIASTTYPSTRGLSKDLNNLGVQQNRCLDALVRELDDAKQELMATKKQLCQLMGDVKSKTAQWEREREEIKKEMEERTSNWKKEKEEYKVMVSSLKSDIRQAISEMAEEFRQTLQKRPNENNVVKKNKRKKFRLLQQQAI